MPKPDAGRALGGVADAADALATLAHLIVADTDLSQFQRLAHGVIWISRW